MYGASEKTRTLFQSTLPVRGATEKDEISALMTAISIHAPRAGSDVNRHENRCCGWGISIHAPRAGSDGVKCAGQTIPQISIHAPRAGSDVSPSSFMCDEKTNFNPRSPCGERRCVRTISASWRIYFNPRSPCGERPGSTSQRAAKSL